MRIASINFYMGNKQPLKDAEFIEDLDIDSAGYQEMWRHLSIVERHIKNHKFYWDRRNTKGAREVAVSLNTKRNKFLGTGSRIVSDLEPGEETKIFKERWITVVRYMHKGRKYAHINYHGNAVVQSKKTGKLLLGAERVREWVEGSIIIQRRIKSLQKRGYRVFVTGDWNYRRMRLPKFVLAYWSPQKIFERCNLEYVEHGLDYIAWPKEMRKTGHKVIPTTQTGSDHPWLVVDVV